MINLDFNKINKIHFIGVAGISMSGLAKFMLNKGCSVSGSDIKKNHLVEDLINNGLIFYNEHNENNVKPCVDLVVFSGAINENNPEILMAKKYNILVIERSEFLEIFSKQFKNVIAISGSHGKTTTTAIIGKIFQNAGLNPTIALGGEYADLNTNMVIGGLDYLIIEACEYRESFKYLNPDYEIITNVEPEHLDYYKTFENEILAFKNFTNSAKKMIVGFKNNCENFLDNPQCKVLLCDENSNYFVSFLENRKGKQYFTIKNNNALVGEFETSLMGEYNIKNATLAIAFCVEFGLKIEDIINGLKAFNGVKRRNELLGFIEKVPVVADYAHHPTEIKSSILNVVRNYGKVLCVFQPHTFSRTKTLLNEFSTAFVNARKVVVFKTYSAREKYNAKANGKVLCEKIINKNKEYISNKKMLLKKIKCEAILYDVVLILGAGDIYDIFKNK